MLRYEQVYVDPEITKTICIIKHDVKNIVERTSTKNFSIKYIMTSYRYLPDVRIVGFTHSEHTHTRRLMSLTDKVHK